MKQLLISTGNRHKTEEIRAMLGEGWTVRDLTSYPEIVPAEETGDTFEANARIKALHLSEAQPELLVLSDDSGLEVDALGGAPGVISARYAGVGATDADNRTKLKLALRDKIVEGEGPPYKGRFRCCMVLAQGGRELGIFNGAVEGTLLLEEEGEGGFGYDSLFVPEGHDQSFGVLPSEVKNGLSHRGRALAQVKAWLESH
ncbi:XTP/dITP diphosphohydrolase [Roseimicrobium gellanilyticum]|uniref:dITP/XTP pyrophosphatase n=1 Tax=Roseimicrobium gellanilyticum TaxID=748857 RepID=A0A366HLW4_9BACT|nr:non-canonical purine NTP pyrophosphatase [Roseimicrobium gellanilyticum]RBP43918.1 XTP/dITP diphosphohydrolase [Roseimicrobium gellanilyticum]